MPRGGKRGEEEGREVKLPDFGDVDRNPGWEKEGYK